MSVVTRKDSPATVLHKEALVPPQKLRDPPDTNGWLTREESALVLGVSRQTIKNYERRGLLQFQRVSRQDTKGRKQLAVVHDPSDVEKLRETQDLAKQMATSATTANDTTATANDTTTWLTRNESIDLLSVSIQTLKNYEERGLLHPMRVPRRDARGHEQTVVVYDPKELAKLPRGNARTVSPREPGELNARCFELFEQGKSNREIVIALRETSEKIRALREMWLDDGGAALVISDEAKRVLETLLGPFEDIAGLIILVTKYVAVEHKSAFA